MSDGGLLFPRRCGWGWDLFERERVREGDGDESERNEEISVRYL